MKKIFTLIAGLSLVIFSANSQVGSGNYYTEDFENSDIFSQWQVSSISGSELWVLESGLPYGDIIEAGSGNTNACFASYNYNGDISFLTSPSIDLSASVNPVLSFSYVQPAWSLDQDTLKVYYKSSQDNNWILLGMLSENITAWTELRFALPDASSDYYIAFEAKSGYGYGTGIDNISIVKGEQCANVFGLEINNVKENSVSLRWNESGCNSFEIEYGETGFIHGEGQRISGIKNTSAFINELSTGTAYDIYIRAFCNEGISEWSDVLQVVTECGIGVYLPYLESFENNANPFECWEIYYANSEYNLGNEVIADDDNSFFGNNSLRFSSFEVGAPYDQYLVSPEIDVDEFTEISFMYKALEGSSETFAIGFSSSATSSLESAEWVDYIYDASEDWKSFSTLIPQGTKHIYVHYSTQFGYYLYLDNIRIGHPINCSSVANISVPETETDYAVISWSENEDVYAVEYGLNGFEKGTGTTVYTNGQSQIKIENLIVFTQYNAYILTNCEGNQNYSDAVSFYTNGICAEVDEINASEIGETHAQLSWTSDAFQDGFNIEYGLHGFITGNGTLESSYEASIFIENLNPDTEYDIYVQAICSSWGNSASWSEAYTFRTAKDSDDGGDDGDDDDDDDDDGDDGDDDGDDDINVEPLTDIFMEDGESSSTVISISTAKPIQFICGNSDDLYNVDLILKNEGTLEILAGTSIDYIITEVSLGLIVSETVILSNTIYPGEDYQFSTSHAFNFNAVENPVSVSLSDSFDQIKTKSVEISFVRLVSQINIDDSENNTIFSNSFPYELTANVNSNSSEYGILDIYKWSNGDSHFETIIDEAGVYTFTVSNNYCSLTETVTVKSEMENISDNFQIFPNPTHGVITITNVLPGSPVSFSVYDAAGRLVHKESVSELEQTIDLSKLSAGMYSAVFTQSDNTVLKRLFIE